VSWLVCTNCGTRNTDPGGPPSNYYCGHCGHNTLVRAVPAQNTTDNTVAGAAILGTLGALAFGPFGALAGAVLGGVIGGSSKKDTP
jgi:DNA-directed RNA polymerase subunit RPC12/RpoP